MDAKLRRALDAIARDNRSGAAELALCAANAILEWTKRNGRPARTQLMDVACKVMGSQPAMAPFLRLGNEVALSADRRDPCRTLRVRIERLAEIVQMGPSRIASRLVKTLPPKPDNLVATYSYSSTVVQALIRAKSRILGVYCSEARPGSEGRKTAALLAKAGIDVLFCTDAKLLSGFGWWTHLIVGADAVLPTGFSNKVGTSVMVQQARDRKAPTWVLADTTKFNPWITGPASFAWLDSRKKPTRIWESSPKGVSEMGGIFEGVEYGRGIALLTEKGWLTPRQIVGFMRKIKVSPQFRVAGKLIA